MRYIKNLNDKQLMNIAKCFYLFIDVMEKESQCVNVDDIEIVQIKDIGDMFDNSIIMFMKYRQYYFKLWINASGSAECNYSPHSLSWFGNDFEKGMIENG